MRRLASLALAGFLWLCQAVRLDHDRTGRPKPHAKLRERHLQYLFVNRGGGIHDRLFCFTWLLRLGRLHNATTHIRGGTSGARMYLHPKHSRVISGSWETYFDTAANDGSPFHPVDDELPGCRTVDDPLTDLATLFDDGVMCVNLAIGALAFKNKWPPGLPDAMIPPSRHVRGAAALFRRRLPRDYGAIHIRRCDLLEQGKHRECTAVDAVHDLVAKHNNFSAWFVSMYAEEGYRELLFEALQPLGRRLLFEDERALNRKFPGDNYFTNMVANEIKGNAALILDSHQCPFSTMKVIPGHTNGQILSKDLSDFEASRLEDEESEVASDEDRFGDREGGYGVARATCNPGW